MNLQQIKYFHAVCTYKTLSAAADLLYISQPALSSAIKELEKEFGVALFARCHKGMVLTAAGEAFYTLSKDILLRAEQVEASMRDLGEGRKVLRLGVPPMIGSLLLPQIYRGFTEMHPDIELKITEGGREELTKKLSEKLLDMIFLPHSASIEKGLASMHVTTFEIVCCVNKKNGLSALQSVTPATLDEIPVVLFKDSFFQTGMIKKWFLEGGIVPKILLQTDQLSTASSLIASDLAVGFLFRQLVEKTPEFCPIPTKAPLFIDVSLVWERDAYVIGSMNKFSEYVKQNIRL